MPDSQATLIDQTTPEQDQPGDLRGTHLQPGEHGITNRPQQEAERQSKVVDDRQQPGRPAGE